MRPAKSLLAAAAGVVLAIGCALTPPAAEQALENARAAYRSAQADLQVPALAPAELNHAGRTLNEAERLAKEGADGELIAHQAYLAEQRSNIARNTAAARAAEAEMAKASDRRERVLLEGRAREAEAAREHVTAQAREASERAAQAAQQARDAEQARIAALEQARATEHARAQAQESRAAELASQERLSAEVRRLESELSEMKARETVRGWMLTLGNDVLFDVGQATLKPGAQRAVDHLADFLREHPQRQIAIEGFTDSTGSSETNRRLSEQRAEAVKQALIARGIEAQRIEARGYGPDFPVASNDTPTGRQLNRRVEILIPAAGTAATGATR